MPWMMPTPYAARGLGGCFIGTWWEDGVVANNDLTTFRLDGSIRSASLGGHPACPRNIALRT